MEILRIISSYSKRLDISFVLIGGHAVNFYGLSRQTGDIDLLTDRAQKSKWASLLSELKYNIFKDDTSFSRFKNERIDAWPIDIMYTDSDSFRKIFDASAIDNELRIVSREHLVILKLHALKQEQPHRYPKDYGDLLSLIRTSKGSLSKDLIESLCKKYSKVSIYDKLLEDGAFTS